MESTESLTALKTLNNQAFLGALCGLSGNLFNERRTHDNGSLRETSPGLTPRAAKHAKKGKAWVQNRIMPVLLFFAIFASSRETCLPLWLSPET
jgi:hypothetical protein